MTDLLENARLLLNPSSVAVVGASERGDKPGTRLSLALARGFAGPVYGVNPRRFDLPGLTWVPSVEELPETPDIALMVLSAEQSVKEFERLCLRGVRAVIVFSGGFSESGAEGKDRERRLVELAQEHGVALCGPNTAGVLDQRSGFVGTFTHALDQGAPPSGPCMLVTQSGAVGGILLTHLRDRGVGVGSWISVGNGAVLDVPDYLDLAAEDDGTEVVALFLEGLHDGRRFQSAVERCVARGKRVLAYKGGRSALGASAAASHTGKLAGSDRVYDGVFAQSGVTRANSLRELVDLMQTSSLFHERTGDRGAVLSVSGAGCTILADEVSAAGLRLATFADETRERLRRALPSFGQLGNPVDLTGKVLEDLCLLRETLLAVQADPEVDFAVLTLATNNRQDIAACIADAWDETTPLAVVTPVAGTEAAELRAYLSDRGIATFTDLSDVVPALASIPVAPGGAPVAALAPEGHRPPEGDSGWVTGDEAMGLLAGAGLPVPASSRVATDDDAVAAAASMGVRVVVKVDHPRLLHKTEVGGVQIVRRDEVPDACRRIREGVAAAGVEFEPDGGFVVQELVEPGVEVLVGMTTDPTFGAILTVGIGGIWVEVLDQVVSRVMPVTEDVVRAAVAATKLGELLEHDRRGRRDVDALVSACLKLQEFLVAHPDVVEAEVNPLVVGAAGEGVRVVDARLRLAAS